MKKEEKKRKKKILPKAIGHPISSDVLIRKKIPKSIIGTVLGQTITTFSEVKERKSGGFKICCMCTGGLQK